MINSLFLSIIMFVIVTIFFVIDYGLMNRYDRKREANKGWSWDYTLFTIGLGLLVILQPWLLPFIGWTTENIIGIGVQLLGGLLVLASFVLHIWSRLHLRQFYVERVELQDKHQVIKTGPYTYVRHPIFTSFFVLTIGLVLLNPSIATLAVMIYTFWDFSRAAKQEEEILAKSLPDYANYMSKTSRFLPTLWRKKS